MASLSRKGLQKHAKPVMNVTPLVDVVLVLLIIFMVVIPAMEQGLDLEMPGIFNTDAETPGEADAFVLSLTANRELLLDEMPVPHEHIERVLRNASSREPTRRLVLRVDRHIPYGEVRSLYRVVQNARFPGVSMRVNRRQDESALVAAN